MDIALPATDESCAWPNRDKALALLDWTRDNMDDCIGAYGTHWYVNERAPSDTTLWAEYNEYFACLVQRALACGGKRYILGDGNCGVCLRMD